ncbi:hypothetical protein N6H05_19450 [Sphingobium sp. WTD-1]|uniref:hypothetical protein n=1 Tax=Sphingobium sp. WTD-1 TaxID=2979467 RepID=UPI0024DED9C5|nr:hypothetical protein [Sphingobium sp. WTD-1]WIA55186.1 hypothetical protein N6H05_19450 [Sphingobium sp. WTD-1]
MFNQGLSTNDRKRLLSIAKVIVKEFTHGDWQTLGAHTASLDTVTGHPRLLRSLSFGDEDYEGCAHTVLNTIVERDIDNLAIIEEFVGDRYEIEGINVSTAPSKSRPVIFHPSVFELPDSGLERDLVAVMCPFTSAMEPVFEAINDACIKTGFRAQRAKDIWDHSVLIQDIFSLIFRSHIVVCDFTGKNPNVFYEAGIAHTLGKHVIPITQSADDVPFDLRHHRFLPYLNNNEGRSDLGSELAKRFAKLR